MRDPSNPIPPDIGRPLTAPNLRLVQKSGRLTMPQWARFDALGGWVMLRALLDDPKFKGHKSVVMVPVDDEDDGEGQAPQTNADT